MALINCKNCGKQISDKATNCIHCGYPIFNAIQKEEDEIVIDNIGIINNSLENDDDKKQSNKKVIIIISCLFFLILVVILFNSKNDILMSNENKKYNAICRRNMEIIVLVGTDNKTSIEHTISDKNNNSSIDVKVKCNSLRGKLYGDGIDADFNYDENNCVARYEKNIKLEDVVYEIEGDDYQCVIYGNDSNENKNIVVGTWCLEFENDGYKTVYKNTYYPDGTYERYQIFEKMPDFNSLETGIYSFDGNKIKAISLTFSMGVYDYSNSSSYDEYMSYNRDDDSFTNSNMRDGFANKYIRCDG